MKNITKNKRILFLVVAIISILALAVVAGYFIKESQIQKPLGDYMLDPQSAAFKLQEQAEGKTPGKKLEQIVKSIIDKDQKSYEETYSVINLGHIGLYEGEVYESIGKINQNALRQRENIKSLLWRENFTDFQVLESKFYNQPCCSVGWEETSNQEWIGMARYEVELITKDSRKLKYNIEVTVSNPDWIQPGTQLEVRKWVITNISDNDLPQLYKGF